MANTSYKQLVLLSILTTLFSLNAIGQSLKDPSSSTLHSKNEIIETLKLKGSQDGDLNFEKGVKTFNGGDFKSAINLFNKTINDDPFDVNSYFNRGLCYYKMEDKDHACIDWKYAAYLGEKSSTKNYFSICNIAEDSNTFRESGIVVPLLKHSDNVKDELLDSEPSFPNGLDSLKTFLTSNLKITPGMETELTHTIVWVKFTVSSDGQVKFPFVLNRNSPFKNEAERLIMIMPKWKPAYKNGRPFSCEYISPMINKNDFLRKINKQYNDAVGLLQQSKFAEAVLVFDDVIKMRNDDRDAYYNRGICYYRMSDTTKACKDWSAYYHWDNDVRKLLVKFCDSLAIYKGDLNVASNPDTSKIYTKVEKMPEFPGGEEELLTFLQRNIRYPPVARENGIMGVVYVTFIVSKDGSIRFIRVLRGIGGGCDEEALRVIKLMPKWILVVKMDNL